MMNFLKEAIPIANLPVVIMLLTSSCSAGLPGYDSSYTKLYYTSYSVLPKAVIRSSQESENSDRHDFSTIDEASQAQQQLGEFCQTAPFSFLTDPLVSSPHSHRCNKDPSLICSDQSYQTIPTVIISGGYQCKSKRRQRHVSSPTDSIFTSGWVGLHSSDQNPILLSSIIHFLFLVLIASF